MRIVVFVVGYIFYLVDCLKERVAVVGGMRQYVRAGHCKHCGRCCRNLAIEVPEAWVRYNFVVKLMNKWHQLAYNFRPVGLYGNWLIYECGYLDSSVRCRIYPFRHRICRQFPAVGTSGRLYSHPDCGFYFVRRDGRPTFKQVLSRIGSNLGAE